MKEILAQIAATILMDKAAAELGMDIHDVVCEQVKKLAAKLPNKQPGDYFTVELGPGRANERVPVPNDYEREQFSLGNKLEAVKAYKNRTGLSLLISKYAVEQYN